ncbi:MAG: bifunctional 2-polyprenyl-6-hydroxyphenol methylase/3-demethylubiquinol 3-O-methyltransferase UbiG [Rickettsiales bacterium]|nr:bifunctional 2-polyprenyl-6-hydroxyphenol methylase/3-demethylubiquinol 3-O-methyltransferase UbiG [Rickettsiales bacterium]
MTTIDQSEIEKFSRIADEWWDPNGKFKPLHKFNPIRVNYIKNQIKEKLHDKFSQLNILDVGCGGGLVSEQFAKLNANITGIDASEKNIKVASIHAEKSNLDINYINTSAEDLVKENKQYDIVLALEIIEHVADVEKFVINCAKLVKQDGLLFIATLNRTIKSIAMAKYGVEYVLRWLPIGTHDWRKFLKPSEIEAIATKNNLSLIKQRGFSYNLLKDEWKEDENLDINYISLYKKY